MVKERLAFARPAALAFAALWSTLGLAAGTAHAQGPIFLSEATQQGAFNVGAARATPATANDPTAGSVLRLNYTLPRGTAAGLWAKAFPRKLDAESADVARLGARAVDPEQTHLIAVSMEVKGSAGVQRIPLSLQPGWSYSDANLDWPKIGTLSEVVISVNRIGDVETASGAIDLDVRFERLSWSWRLSTLPAARIGGVLAVSLIAGLAVALLRGALGRGQSQGTAWRAGLAWDLVLGAGVVGIASLGGFVDLLGERGALEVGWTAVAVAFAGAGIAEWLKFGLTGKHLSAAEVFRDMFATGLLAASTSPLVILQAPASWSELLMLSQTVAAVAVVAYHAANAYRLGSSGKHLGPIAGAILVGTPYAVGWLLLLASPGLLEALGGGITVGTLAKRPEVLKCVARVLVVFAFNEAAANALGLATKRTLLRSARGHLTLLAVAVAVTAAPWVAALGSDEMVASWSIAPRLLAIVLTTILSQGPLWAEVYLITGMVMDAIHGLAPTRGSVSGQSVSGLKKGMVYSGVFMGILQGLGALGEVPAVWAFAKQYPVIAATLFGALAFPLVKTIIETFDGSQAFFRRAGKGYRTPTLYLRGAVVGLGLGYAVTLGMSEKETAARAWFGFRVGLTAFAGVNLLRDFLEGARGRGRVQSWRVYLVQSLLGGAIGAAVGFYFDAAQVAVVVAKFHKYLEVGRTPVPYDVRPLLSKWGLIDLGTVNGGVRLLFDEALDGVISWSIPAWMFAINATFMTAYFRKESAPIRALFTAGGLAQLTENMIAVLRWGLWMAPIIKSFLRMTGEPTWYNQDGAIRTLIATYHDATMTPDAFRAWSLNLFICLLAYDWVRILIWLDHFGLRVATLVNLSFLGMDRLDERLSRFLAPSATARCIPEAVKRFTTWAPLLIPFYIPRGKEWDDAWSRSQAIQQADTGGYLSAFVALPVSERMLILSGAIVACTAVFSVARRLKERRAARVPTTWVLKNSEYEVVLRDDGAVVSRIPDRDYDVTRRSYDYLDPAGRALFLVDDSGSFSPVVGNFPGGRAEGSRIERFEDALRVVNTANDLRTTVEITLPDPGDPVELWTVTVENLSNRAGGFNLVPYLEWVLNRPDSDRGHTQYNRLFAEMEYVHGLHAVLAWDKHSKALGFVASDVVPDGFLTARLDFVGRARSVWKPLVLETMDFSEPADTESHPTFDPIGSLLLGRTVPAHGTARVCLLIGLVADKATAIELIARHLQIAGAGTVGSSRVRKASHSIGHGEIPADTPRPYTEFSDDGRTMRVRTPFTPRPFDHTMSNALGHVVSVTNRGLHTTSSVNAQQNRLTPDWADTVTREVPAEAFYLFDPATDEWFSPTYHPLNDPSAAYDVTFGVDGTAVYRMSRGSIESELTVFVPPDEPAAVYRLTVRNLADGPRRLRLAPYFQMVLAGQPEQSGPLRVRRFEERNAILFENPRNTFRTGPAFVAMSVAADRVETERGRFFGEARDVSHPYMVERGEPDVASTRDDRPIAAFLTTLEVPARGESTVVVVLGQADDRTHAEAVIRKYLLYPNAATASLDRTRAWWLALMGTLTVETGDPEFDRYLDWLKYQALAERIWARRGFYQASGAFGFRDQLQDSVNLIWMDPAVARKQILLHASQQFIEGDVVHWFHLLQDSRTGFVGRTHASDNLLWLAWGVVEYVGMTGDDSLLDERTAYLESEQPFEPLPAGKAGMGFDPLRSSREDTVYRHCMKAIDLVLDKRMGVHGLPLMGTGDWNDGLDEIGSEGKGESVWLGLFLYYILDRMIAITGRKDGPGREAYYRGRLQDLKNALEQTWRGDRYLRAFHDDGTEIGVKGSGVWEIDALTAAWAVMSGINPVRGRVVFDTALGILEQETTILLGWPSLREDTKPYLGRSSAYPEGVRENGMYCHGDQWLVGAARILADRFEREGQPDEARRYRETARRLWRKISPISHVTPDQVDIYGGQPNKQSSDMVTTFDPGRMIWNGYTGAAGWMFRQALEGVLGLRLVDGRMILPTDPVGSGEPAPLRVSRELTGSPLREPERS